MILNILKALTITLFLGIINTNIYADTPIFLFDSYAGNVSFVGAQKTRRTQANGGTGTTNACQVLGQGVTNSTTISGIPTGSTISAAHLYWAGSNSTAAGSTRTTPDFNVVFEGNSIVADRQYTSNFPSDPTESYFNGVEDVTSIVQARSNPNGTYSFSGLEVNTAAPHCTFNTVMAGWALVIVYEHPSEDFRVINLFEGFELIYGSSVTLTPNNFRIPNSPINGKHAYLTWDGDAENSGTRNNVTERLTFNGTSLTDANNPTNNVHNSISTIGGLDTNSYGVDFDEFPIDSLLSPGDTSATSIYSSGADQVHLSMEIISVTNTPVSDLSISKTASSAFNVGNNATYTIAVNNAGPNDEPGNIVVTDTLPAGLTFVSGTGTAWNCSAAGQNVTCTRTGSLASGTNAAPITLTVAVTNPASPSVTNTASVTGTNFDNISANNTNSDTTTVTNNNSTALAVGTCDAFENDLGNWTINSSGGTGEISSLTAQSPSQSLDLYGGTVNATSVAIDTSSNFDELTIWIRRGSDAFSENPDTGEDLLLQYLNSSNAWITLETFTGSGTQGEIFNRTYTMPAAAQHANYRIRLALTNASAGNFDHWHIDDVCLTETAAPNLPTINLQKTSVTLTDPVNGSTNPKAIPGALAQYVINATNTGTGAADNNTVNLTDAIPANTALFVNDISGAGTGPIRFVDGSPPSGLTYNFSGLGNGADNLFFSNDNGVTFNYTPSPDADGVDTNVTNIRVTTTGQFLASSGSGNPSFSILFRVKVQ